jgi:hypothetical protein
MIAAVPRRAAALRIATWVSLALFLAGALPYIVTTRGVVRVASEGEAASRLHGVDLKHWRQSSLRSGIFPRALIDDIMRWHGQWANPLDEGPYLTAISQSRLI